MMRRRVRIRPTKRKFSCTPSFSHLATHCLRTSVVWNLSQNVDRSIGSGKPGICPCLTPSMIPYITNRGGPMVGIEALSMQGLPVDELLLTRETEDQLADLAGNAMSTTVVGACIMAALIVGKKYLKDGNDNATYEQKHDLESVEEEDDDDVQEVVMDINKLDIGASAEDHITGEAQLGEKPLDLAASSSRRFSELLEDGQKSSRLCECEGRKDMTSRELRRCRDCGASSCVKCGGRPEHNLEPIDLAAHPRLSPSAFERELKAMLPMAILISSVTQELLNELRAASKLDIPSAQWSKWCAAVIRATADELHFAEAKRQEIWTVIFQSPFARMELLLHPQQPEWRFYAKSDATEPATSAIRAILEAPAGRFVCKDGLLEGHWEFALPVEQAFSVAIEGDELVPSWEAKVGLQGADFKEKMVHSQLEVSVPAKEASKLERDISGTYMLYDKCGNACSSLHRRVAKSGEQDLPPVFLFLDPKRSGNPANDSFVFSISRRRYDYGESRPIICTVDKSWRQSSVEGTQEVQCYTPSQWRTAPAVRITVRLHICSLRNTKAINLSFSRRPIATRCSRYRTVDSKLLSRTSRVAAPTLSLPAASLFQASLAANGLSATGVRSTRCMSAALSKPSPGSWNASATTIPLRTGRPSTWTARRWIASGVRRRHQRSSGRRTISARSSLWRTLHRPVHTSAR